MSTRHNFRNGVTRGFAALVGLALLSACGGGGGSAGGGSGNSPDRNLPLSLGSANASEVSTESLRAVEGMMEVAQQAVDEIVRVSRNGNLQFDRSCGPSHFDTTHYTLMDNDGNRVPSAGDTVQVAYTTCELVNLGTKYNGSLNISLRAVENAAHGDVSGTIEFGSGLAPFEQTRNIWLGSMNFRHSETSVQEKLEVSSAATDSLRQKFWSQLVSGWRSQTDVYSSVQVVRTLQRDTARASLTGSFTLASERFGGKVSVTLDPEFGGVLNTHPDSGFLTVLGALGSRVKLVPSPAGKASMQVELDSNGDGAAESSTTLPTVQLFDGFLWAQQYPLPFVFLNERDDTRLSFLLPPDLLLVDGMAPNDTFRVQFNQALRPDAVFVGEFVDGGSPLLDIQYGIWNDALSEPSSVVPAVVEVHGAVLLMRPTEKLRYGHGYGAALYSLDALGHRIPVVFQSATGIVGRPPVGESWCCEVNNMLWTAVSGAGNRSVVMPGQKTTITANVPKATSLPLSFRWAQLSGPRVTFGSTDSATTTVDLPADTPPGIGRVMLQVTVTDALGRTESTPVEMQVANPNGVARLLYFSGGLGDIASRGQTRIYSGETGGFLAYTVNGPLNVRYDEPAPGHLNWSLELQAPHARTPIVGHYADAVGVGDPSTDRPKISFGCNPTTGSFDILELEVDEHRNVVRLAVDFEQTCVSSTPTPMHGSVRINSSLPIKR